MPINTDSVPDNAELIEKAFSLFPGTTSFAELYSSVHLGPNVSSWLLNLESELHAVKEHLLHMDPAELSSDDQEWRKDILWSWYTDVFDHLLWVDRVMAAEQRSALAHQYVEEIRGVSWFQDPAEDEDQFNLARGWAFIVNDDVDEIPHWVDLFKFAQHANKARELADIYMRNRSTAPVIMSLAEVKAVAACA